MTVLLVALGAAVGAPLRFLTDRAVQRRHDSVFPWGTFGINVSGSGLLGFLVAAGGLPGHLTVACVAFCGAFTTFSTFGYETLRLLEDRAYLYAGANVMASVVTALGAAYLGMALANAILG